MTGWWLSVALWVSGCGLALSAAAAQADELDEEALKRISYDVQFLASDELAGRGVGSPGIETAAKYVIDEYKKIGLKSGVADGSFRQPFKVNIGRQLVPNSFALKFTGPQGLEIVGEAGKNGQPMMVGGTADLTADLVFVGYGINAAEHNYNEYAAVDVKGKVVVLIRLEPQQNSDQSVFDGTTASNYARVRTKIATAAEAGAAGIILVNDGATADSDEKDELMQPDGFGRTGDTPFVQVKRSVIDEMLRVSPIPNPNGGNFDTLAKIEAYLDEKLEPVSAPIDEWKVHYQAKFESVDADAYNLVGVLEGEGPLAKEYVVIGGHYDHLGFGEVGSRAPDRREIHNGADDNATGTAAVLELARRFARYDQKPKRTMVFICFSAEERGLLGSAFYVNEEKPLFDLAQTAAMINYDMIGWLREDKLTVFGTGSGSNFGDLLDKAAAGSDLKLDRVDSPFAGSDHMPFFQKGVPVMFLHTGLTDTYHTPEDDFQTLNMSVPCASSTSAKN